MKIIPLLIIITTIINSSNAQETSIRERIQVGLKIGTNYSNVYDSQGDEFNASSKFGLAAGAFMALPVGKYVGIQPEILFSQKGFSATGKLTGKAYDITRTTSYIDIPLFVTLKPTAFTTVLVGPQYSYLIQQKDAFANASTSIATETEFENASMRKNTLCLVGGFDINVKHFLLGARLGWDVRNNHGDGTSSTPRYRNTWLQVAIGYRIYN